MQADPEVKAHYHQVQPYIRTLRRAPFMLLLYSAMLIIDWVFDDDLMELVSAFLGAVCLFWIFRILYSLYRLLELRDIHCPLCKRATDISDKWVCGSCSRTHSYPWLSRTFVERCKECNRLPASLICWNCRNPIMFSDDRSPSAWTPGYPPRAPEMKDRPPEPLIRSLCILHLNTVNQELYKKRPRNDIQADREWCADARLNCFLLYPQWLHIIKNKSYEPANWQSMQLVYDDRWRAIAEWHAKDLNKAIGKYEPTVSGWKLYLKETCPHFYDFLKKRIPAPIPEQARARSTYMVAKPGAGKSECLKRFIHSYLSDPECATMVIDPAGEFAEQVAKWEENYKSDRLIYVDPVLELGTTPIINPFEIHGVPAHDTSDRALAVKRVVAQQILEALQEVVAQGGAEFTANMVTVLKPCILTLLDYEGATLYDLHTFMDHARNRELVSFAVTNSKHKGVRDFFSHSFGPKDHTASRDAIKRKMHNLFTGALAHLTCGKSTINLQKAWDERKIVVFNLSKGKIGDDEAKAFGRLVVSLLQGIAKRRADIEKSARVPGHLFIDEMENFTSESMRLILNESRKYRLMLTVCQQIAGSGLDLDMQRAVLGSTDMKVGGQAEPTFRKGTADQLDVAEQDIAELKPGEFYFRLGGHMPFKMRVYDDLADTRNAMSEHEWERVKARMLATYYRSVPQEDPEQPLIEIIPPPRVPAAPETRLAPVKATAVRVARERVKERVTVETDMKPSPWKKR